MSGWIEQARSNQVEGTDWAILAKRNRETPVVILDAEALFRPCQK